MMAHYDGFREAENLAYNQERQTLLGAIWTTEGLGVGVIGRLPNRDLRQFCRGEIGRRELLRRCDVITGLAKTQPDLPDHLL